MDEDYYRAEFKEIDQQYAKLLDRRMREMEHGIMSGPGGTEYQLFHIGHCRGRLMYFMRKHGISLIKEGDANGKPDP